MTASASAHWPEAPARPQPAGDNHRIGSVAHSKLAILHPARTGSNPSAALLARLHELDLLVKRDLHALMTTPKLGGRRLGGTRAACLSSRHGLAAKSRHYRTGDGRGRGAPANQRFARHRLLITQPRQGPAAALPIKQKYGNASSSALIDRAHGNCAHRVEGFPLRPFGGGRVDIWQAEEEHHWATKPAGGDAPTAANRDWRTLAAVQMGSDLCEPACPNGEPTVASGREARNLCPLGDERARKRCLCLPAATFARSHGPESLS